MIERDNNSRGRIQNIENTGVTAFSSAVEEEEGYYNEDIIVEIITLLHHQIPTVTPLHCSPPHTDTESRSSKTAANTNRWHFS